MVNQKALDNAEFVTISGELYRAQMGLFERAIDFQSAYRASDQQEVLSDLIFKWVVDPAADFTLPKNRNDLHTMFKLVVFLSELKEKVYEVDYFINELGKGEVSNG